MRLSIPIVLVLGIWLFFQVIVDDSFIFYKYGYNLIQHGVWNWNINDQPVEAYTSFVYAVLSIIPALLQVPPHIFTKLFGLATFLFIVIRILYKFCHHPFKWLAVFILVTNWQIYVHTFACLETMFWFLLLMETFYLIVEDDFSIAKQWRLWLLCFLLTLTRPEGAIYGFGFFVYLKWIKKIRIHIVSLITVIGMGAIYFIVRYWKYKMLFPLPFYHKAVSNNFGILSFIANIYFSWIYLFTSAIILYLLRKNRPYFFLASLTFFIYFILYSRSFLVMNYSDRFTFQVFFPILVLAILTLNYHEYVKRVSVIIAIVFFNALIFSKGIYDNNFIELASIPNNAMSGYYISKSHYLLAKKINEIDSIEHKKIKIAFGDAGVFPYYVKANCIDLNGLTDVYLSSHPLNESYFNKINADVVLAGTPEENVKGLKLDITNGHILYAILDKQKDIYSYLGYVTSKKDGYYVHIFIKKQSIYFNDLQHAMQKAIDESANTKFNIKRFLKWKYINYTKD